MFRLADYGLLVFPPPFVFGQPCVRAHLVMRVRNFIIELNELGFNMCC